MTTASEILVIVSLIAPLFTRLNEEDYTSLTQNEGSQVLGYVPTWRERSIMQNELFVPGMPLAALPVESLYKAWSTLPGSSYGSQKGLYLGDSAHHMTALCAQLELDVPEQFKAMPDHLTLLLEVFVLLFESGNRNAACQFASDHLDWLEDYQAALESRSDEVVQASVLAEEKRKTLVRGIEQVRVLVGVVRTSVAHLINSHEARYVREPLATVGDVR